MAAATGPGGPPADIDLIGCKASQRICDIVGRVRRAGTAAGTVPSEDSQPRRRNMISSAVATTIWEPTPANQKAEKLVIRPIIQPKFCPKKPVKKLRGKNTVAMMVSCFITTFKRLDTVDRWVSRARSGDPGSCRRGR